MEDQASDGIDGFDRSWLIRTKLTAPILQRNIISRPSLVARFYDVSSAGLIILTAPAGFGKTTVLSQWQATMLAEGVKCGWISLDEDDSDINLFLSYVVLALVEAGAALDRLETLALQGLGTQPPRTIIASLIDELEKSGNRFVLILDDFHRIQNEVINHLIEDIIKFRSENLVLVLSSRLKPSMDLTPYIVSGQVAEVDGEALRLSKEETRSVIDKDLPDSTLDQWFGKIEGWAVAAQLARLITTRGSGGAVGDNVPFVQPFDGADGHIASYLTEQVIAQLDGPIQDLLVKTSIFERFTFELASHVSPALKDEEIVQSFAALSALVVPIGKGEAWLRYHHLFAECLLGHLAARFSPREIKKLHSEASKWFEQRQLTNEAVKHACAAEDYDAAARLIEKAGAWELILFGGIGHLRSLLRYMPEAATVNFSRILVAKSYLAMKDGNIDDAETLLNLAMERHKLEAGGAVEPSIPLIDFDRDVLNIQILLDAYRDNFQLLEKQADFDRAIASIADDDNVTRGVIECNRLLHMFAHGDFSKADQTGRDAKVAMRLSNTVLGLNYCYLHAGLAAFYRADFPLAEANFWEASVMAEDNFGADSGLQSLAQILLSGMFYWQGGFNEPETIQKFIKAFDHVKIYDGWFEIFSVALELGFFHDVSGTSVIPTNALETARQIAQERGIGRLQHMVDACDIILCIRNGDPRAADLAHMLGDRFAPDCWKRDSFLWRPFQMIAAALTEFYENRDRSLAIQYADSRVNCCETLGANLYAIPALLTRSQLIDKTGNREQALKDFFKASDLAASHKVYQPFMLRRELGPLLRAAGKVGKAEAISPIVQRFISDCIKKQNIGIDAVLAASDLSSREYEVLLELDAGLANKEIARSLDLTEHTVKFHLKNIYQKLEVERRQQAISVARSRNIIT